MSILLRLAIIGNIAYILFLLYNAIDERALATSMVQIVAPLGLVVLLAVDTFFLARK